MILTESEKRQQRVAAVFVIILWAITAVLGFLNVLILRSVVLRTYLRFVPDGFNAIPLINIMLLISMAIGYVAIAIGGVEYHRIRVGKPESWRMFSRVLAIEIAILLLPLFL